jgi:asparagine synthase (glutamine-hydrolysing)
VGQWTDGAIGLGWRVPETVAEARAGGVPARPAGPLVVAADIRIDNRTEILRALDRSPADPAGDPALLLAAYARWGDRCAERVLGDFAAAIWDGRERCLVCLRDRSGVRPIYYHHVPGRLFAFASEIKALLALPDVPRRLNEARIADYVESMLHEMEETFYAGIRRLPPAHVLRIDARALTTRRYWALDSSRTLRLPSDRDYADMYRSTFFDAVRARVRGDGPVGTTLSGGLDSTSVACAARVLLEGSGRPLHAFSLVFDGVPQSDERRFIDATLALGDFGAHRIVGDASTPLTDLAATIAHHDEPFYAPNLFLHQAIYRAARDAGVAALLDGLDGDTTVSHGMTWLGELASGGRWRDLAREVRGVARRHRLSTWRVVRGHVIPALVPDSVRTLARGWRRWSGRARGAGAVDTVLRADFARRIGWADRAMRLDVGERPRRRSEQAEHHRRLSWGLLSFVLEVVDRESARWGIVPAYPFFDSRLIELCLALPPELKLRDGWTRYVMRTAMDGILPRAVQWRVGKANLAPSFRRGLAVGAPDVIPVLAGDDGSALAHYVELPRVRAAYERFRVRPTDADALTIWKVATVGIWLRDARVSA